MWPRYRRDRRQRRVPPPREASPLPIREHTHARGVVTWPGAQGFEREWHGLCEDITAALHRSDAWVHLWEEYYGCDLPQYLRDLRGAWVHLCTTGATYLNHLPHTQPPSLYGNHPPHSAVATKSRPPASRWSRHAPPTSFARGSSAHRLSHSVRLITRAPPTTTTAPTTTAVARPRIVAAILSG